MKISGFTFVRNAVVYGYPLKESLMSLLPLCDEIFVAAGKSDDNTMEVLESINDPKIKIIPTVWDPNLKKGGLIYSQQTNLAMEQCSGDWCFYLQADEVLSEEDYDLILEELELADKNPNIDALLFKYIHFYGNYDYVGVGRLWYRREIRAFRNMKNIISWGDAQGFRKQNGEQISKLNARQTQARIYHYGWVRHPVAQQKKMLNANAYYNATDEIDVNKDDLGVFDYNSAYELELFKGKHPKIMTGKIAEDADWAKHFNPANKLKKKPFLVALLDKIEKHTNYRIGEFKDFIEVKGGL